MARLRVGGVKPLPASNYVQADEFFVPECVADLDKLPGRCYSREQAVQCNSPGVGIVCRDCAMVELGERWTLFKARTNAAIPKEKFYRDLDREQSEPDEPYRKMMARERRRSQTQG